MPARIQDVARAAGVSTATVSRSLRGLPNVSSHTRTAVSKAAHDLGYVVSHSASTLASGRTLTVAVITPYVSRWFFAQAIEAVERVLRASGFDALLVGVGQPSAAARPSFEPETLRGRVDAVVVLTVPLTGRELDELRALEMPTLFLGAAVAGAMSVRIDDVAVGRMATQHLLELGHRKIAHLGGDPTEPLHFSAPSDRRAGWMSALRAAGLAPVPAYDVPGLFTADGGRAAMDRLLDLGDPPTGVFADSDEMALGALAAIRARGLQVPQDVSVVGVDGHELAGMAGLTTVEQPVDAQGALAARMVLLAVAGDDIHRHEHALMPVRLVRRASTGAPPT